MSIRKFTSSGSLSKVTEITLSRLPLSEIRCINSLLLPTPTTAGGAIHCATRTARYIVRRLETAYTTFPAHNAG